jgi:hypothetical protein
MTETKKLLSQQQANRDSDSLNSSAHKFLSHHTKVALFLLTSTILVIAIALGLFIQNQSLKAKMGLPTFKLPWTQTTCSHNGQIYQAGESVSSIDGCNSCSCDESGQIACTEMACEKVDIRQITDPLSSWESYENDVFSIKYPGSWTIQKQDVSQFKLEKTLESNEPCPIEGYESYTINQNCPLGIAAPGVVWITVEEVFNLDNIIELDTTYQNQEPWVTVDGYEKKGFSGYTGIGASIYMKGFIFKKGDDGYIVSFSTAVQDLIESLAHEADQILSSFAFTRSQSSFTGTLRSYEWPADDPMYHYLLDLDQPYFDELNAQGPRDVSEILVVPADKTIDEVLQAHLNQKVAIEGEIEWGLGETRHLKATQVVAN